MEVLANPKKIVVVDDDHDIREVMTTLLELEGYSVVGLDNGYAALETIADVRPDIVLLDVMLGDIDGRDICKALKQQPSTKGIPVIIVSATHGERKAVWCG